MDFDPAALRVFCLVAEHRSFRGAADRLGVTRSAVSQSVQRLEERLGSPLLVRTTRSVRLTESGERLYASVAPAMAQMRSAVEAATNRSNGPRGLLRLAVGSTAERFLSGPFLGSFTAAHPDIELYINVTDEECDIVAEGYDAGVRLNELIEQDMIAVPIAGEERQLAVCSPAYLERAGAPSHPRDLLSHRCIGWRPSKDVPPYRWEFAENGREFSVAVRPEITTNDMALMVKLAVAGAGITFGMEESFRTLIDRGDLVPLLENYCPEFPAFYLYYPSRRTVEPKLRALIEQVRNARA